jgi:hypothetical protein
MKLKFKDGSVVEGVISSTVTRSRTDNAYAPLLNIVFENGVSFTQVNDLLTEDNISVLEFTNANEETIKYEGFNKSYMRETFSDDGRSFHLSFEKQEVTE